MTCPRCGMSIEETGITVTVREHRLYMRRPCGEGLALVQTIGRPEIENVRCYHCCAVLAVEVSEVLRLDGAHACKKSAAGGRAYGSFPVRTEFAGNLMASQDL